MKLTYLPQWEVINQSQKQFVIQEDANSISLVSPINDYAMGILSQVHFSIQNGEVISTTVENNSKNLKIEINETQSQLKIIDI
ncbi:hypothetical protein AST00_04720 [Staphylococcus equorum]|uniref:hypothetical protein n=1 Tax=Staphylococcus TaxID=1279 RepID=UPI00070B3B44|nr:MULTISPECIES: hypothetical protein [Staphylococcus]KRG09087.1 hypothetical protein ACA31_07935 [Staphylococcus sp. NAM3COL9]MDG0821677.1 hypothetical protein [Staphylococcus equorum]MDG0837478.1 hypothetical protein [Staphylococcus equorum]MDK9872040.1 hypothetical protein [Staphylococcus equorum]MDK9876851.1 hypothetical protein [Staphylococcus equorum]